MKFYYYPGACSFSVRIVLNELNAKYEGIFVDVKTHQLANKEDYYKINPKGQVPFLVLDNGNTLSEIAVIMQYLVESNKATNLLPAVGSWERYKVLEWVNFIASDVHKNMSPLFNPRITPEAKKEVHVPVITTKFEYLNATLKNNQFVCGENFTIADPYFFTMCTWLGFNNIDIKQWPNVNRIFTSLAQRPSIQKSLEQEKK